MNQETLIHLKKVIDDKQVVLMLVSGREYHTTLIPIIKEITKKYSSIVYVTTSKPYPKILKQFIENGIPEEKFYFIDVTPQEGKNMESVKNLIHASSPESLTDLQTKIMLAIDKKTPQIVILDSFHTMLLYHTNSTVARFIHDVISEQIPTECKLLLPTIADDRDNSIIKDLEMFVDTTTEVK